MRPVDYKNLGTGHKGFEAQTNYIGTGNVWSPTLFSNYIRPHSETFCNGAFFAEGELHEADLKPFTGLPAAIRKAVDAAGKNGEQTILYRFQHADAGKRIVHGYVLTRDDRHAYEMLGSWATGPTSKSASILRAMGPHIANPPGSFTRLVDEVAPEAARQMSRYLDRVGGGTVVAIEAAALALSSLDVPRSAWAVWRSLSDDDFRGTLSQSEQEARNEAASAISMAEPGNEEQVYMVMRRMEEIGQEERDGLADRHLAVDALVKSLAARAAAPDAPGARL